MHLVLYLAKAEPKYARRDLQRVLKVFRRVRYRGPDGKLRTLEKVAEPHPFLQGLLQAPLRSVWYDLDEFMKDLEKHKIFHDPKAIIRAILEDPAPGHTVVQADADPNAVRLYRKVETLSGLVGQAAAYAMPFWSWCWPSRAALTSTTTSVPSTLNVLSLGTRGFYGLKGR